MHPQVLLRLWKRCEPFRGGEKVSENLPLPYLSKLVLFSGDSIDMYIYDIISK